MDEGSEQKESDPDGKAHAKEVAMSWDRDCVQKYVF